MTTPYDDNDEPNGLGYWMIGFALDEQVRCRIACPERGYPASEAQYVSIAEWESAHGKKWYEYIAEIA